MNVLGIIPARGGSKGVPQKNIKLLNSKPLIFYTIQAAKASNLSDLIVSTDCPKIAEIAKSFSVKVPFLRPNELSTDHAKSIDVAIHALNKMEEFESKKYDAVMLLQPTTPYRSANHINKALDIIKNKPDLNSVISVVSCFANEKLCVSLSANLIGGIHETCIRYFFGFNCSGSI